MQDSTSEPDNPSSDDGAREQRSHSDMDFMFNKWDNNNAKARLMMMSKHQLSQGRRNTGNPSTNAEEAKKSQKPVEKKVEPIKKVILKADLGKKVVPRQELLSPSVDFFPNSEETKNEEKCFGLSDWISLQDMLQENHAIFENENNLSRTMEENIFETLKKVNKTVVDFKEQNERLKKILIQENYDDEKIRKKIFNDTDRELEEVISLISKLLFSLFEYPQLLPLISKDFPKLSSYREFHDNLVSTFCYDVLSPCPYDQKLIEIIANLIYQDIQSCEKVSSLFKKDSFCEKILAAYSRRKECADYMKILLTDFVYSLIRDRVKIVLDPQEMKNIVNGNSNVPKIKDKIVALIPQFPVNAEQEKLTPQSPRKQSSQKDAFEMVIDEEEEDDSPFRRISNPDVAKALGYNLDYLKEMVLTLIDKMFRNLEQMPYPVRIFCSLIANLTKKKFPNASEKEVNEAIGNFLLRKWMVPCLLAPERNEIVQDFFNQTEINNNLVEIAKAVQQIFSQQLYSPEEIKSGLNPVIQKVIPSIQNYFKELVNIDESIFEVIDMPKPKEEPINNTNNLSSPNKKDQKKEPKKPVKQVYDPEQPTLLQSICITFREIEILCEAIIKKEEQVNEMVPGLYSVAESILKQHKKLGILGDQFDSKNEHVVKAENSYLEFNSWKNREVKSKIDFYNQIIKCKTVAKGAPDDIREHEELKSMIKEFLLRAKSLQNYTVLNSKLGFQDILKKFENEFFGIENSSKIQDMDKVQIHIIARFINSLLTNKKIYHKKSNIQNLYSQIVSELKEKLIESNNYLIKNKSWLLAAYANVKRRYAKLSEALKLKKTVVRKYLSRNFVKTVKLPIYLLAPSLGIQSQEEPDKVELSLSPQMNKAMNNFTDDIDGFINIMGNLKEAKESVITGNEYTGVRDTFTEYYNQLQDKLEDIFTNFSDDQHDMLNKEVENYICRRLYPKLYPSEPIDRDTKFYNRCLLLEWLNYQHLDIPVKFRKTELWDYAVETFQKTDARITPLDKLKVFVETFKIITQVTELASQKGPSGSDETVPLVIYIVLRAKPKRMYSNLHFINSLRDSQKMLSGEGFCFTQIQMAATVIENIDEKFCKMSKDEFEKNVKLKELQYRVSM